MSYLGQLLDRCGDKLEAVGIAVDALVEVTCASLGARVDGAEGSLVVSALRVSRLTLYGEFPWN